MKEMKIPFIDRIAVKSIANIVATLALFSILISVIGYTSFTHAILNQYSESAFKTADIAASVVDADRMDEYAASGGATEEYMRVYNMLDSICNRSRATFVYVIRPDLSDYAHITFLFSTMKAGQGYQHYEFGYLRETTNDDYRQKYQKLYEEESERELVIRDRGYIETDPHITAMVPLKGTDGKTKAILCVQYQMASVVKLRNSFVKKVLITMILVALAASLGQVLYLGRRLLHPLQIITKEASRFASENVMRDEKLSSVIKNRDEIGQLAGAIDQMEEQIQSYVEKITFITAEEEKMKTELSLAARIQLEALPGNFPAFPERNEFDIYASMKPAKDVGGDFYDFFLVDDDHLCLVIADVSGKGIPAALFMMVSRTILANIAMMGMSPREVLEKTNDAICANNNEEMFVTVWLGILEISTGKVTAANAGHEYPVLKKPGRDFEILIDKHGFVVGGMENVKYKEYEFNMEPGAMLFLYTDGLPEATNKEETMFGVELMMDALNESLDLSPKEILDHMKERVDGFVGSAPQFDDLTMLSLEYFGPGGQPGGQKPEPAAEENCGQKPEPAAKENCGQKPEPAAQEG